MKKILFAIILAAGFPALAGLVSSNLLSLATVNNSTNAGSAVQLGTTYLPATTFMIQSANVGGTNGPGGYLYVGFSTNTAHMTLLATITVTNDTIRAFALSSNTQPIYFAFTAFNTTNTAAQIGAQAIQSR